MQQHIFHSSVCCCHAVVSSVKCACCLNRDQNCVIHSVHVEESVSSALGQGRSVYRRQLDTFSVNLLPQCRSMVTGNRSNYFFQGQDVTFTIWSNCRILYDCELWHITISGNLKALLPSFISTCSICLLPHHCHQHYLESTLL